jgi:hypothetical protein
LLRDGAEGDCERRSRRVDGKLFTGIGSADFKRSAT